MTYIAIRIYRASGTWTPSTAIYWIYSVIVCFAGVGGLEGDGDIFRPDNQEAFIKFVHDNTEGQGVHFVMADGVSMQYLLSLFIITHRNRVFILSWQMG